MAARAEKQIVHRQQARPVGQARLGHGQVADGAGARPRLRDYGRQVFHREGQQYPGEAAGVGIDRDHRLTVQVLQGVDYQPVLTDHDHQVVGAE